MFYYYPKRNYSSLILYNAFLIASAAFYWVITERNDPIKATKSHELFACSILFRDAGRRVAASDRAAPLAIYRYRLQHVVMSCTPFTILTNIITYTGWQYIYSFWLQKSPIPVPTEWTKFIHYSHIIIIHLLSYKFIHCLFNCTWWISQFSVIQYSVIFV